MKKIRVGRATTSMVYSPDGKRLVIGDTGRQPPAGSLETWDVNSAHPSLIQRTTSERTFCYCRFPDGKEYAAGATGGVDIFDAGTGKQRARFRTTARAWVVGLGFDERGHLWAGDRFPTMKSMLFEFNAQTGAKLREIVDPFLDLGQICDDGFAISSDGKLLAICTNGARTPVSMISIPGRYGRIGSGTGAVPAASGSNRTDRCWPCQSAVVSKFGTCGSAERSDSFRPRRGPRTVRNSPLTGGS